MLSLLLAWKISIYPASIAIYFENTVHLHFSYIIKNIFQLHGEIAVSLFPRVFILYTHLFPHSLEKNWRPFFIVLIQVILLLEVSLSRLWVIWHHPISPELNTILCDRLLYLDYEYMKEGFASMQQRAMNVSDFVLLVQATHSVAYNVKNVSIQGQVWNFSSSKTKLR